MSNPLLKLTKESLKNLCFGCENCKIEVFISTSSISSKDTIWVRNDKWGAYFDNSSYRARGSMCSRRDYEISYDDKILSSYKELVKIITDRGFKTWFRKSA